MIAIFLPSLVALQSLDFYCMDSLKDLTFINAISAATAMQLRSFGLSQCRSFAASELIRLGRFEGLRWLYIGHCFSQPLDDFIRDYFRPGSATFKRMNSPFKRLRFDYIIEL